MKYIILIVLLLSTFLLFFEGLKNDPKLIPSNLISKKIPKFKLPSLDNRSFEDSDLRTKDLKLINFFASWCPPCKVEHQQLMKLSKSYNVFGIAKKDKSDEVLIWLEKNGDPYKKLGLDEDGLVSIEWGVYGLPETFLIDKQGKIIYKHIGPILKKDLKDLEELINTIK